MADGTYKQIKDLVEGVDVVVTVNPDTLEKTNSKFTDLFSIQSSQLFEIEIVTGVKIKATHDHPFLTQTGWVDVEKLKVGTKLCIHSTGPERNETTKQNETENSFKSQNEFQWIPIQSIRKIENETVMDFTTISSNHSFIAEGFVTHNCGHHKYMALFSHIRIGYPPELIIEKIVKNQQFIPLIQCTPNFKQQSTPLLVNGVLIGYCRNPKDYVKWLRQRRRDQILPFDVSFVFKKKRNLLSVSCDAGCLTRPIYILENLHLFGSIFKEYGNDCSLLWTELLSQGVVEFVDADEETDCVIATTTSEVKLGPGGHTHLELYPTTILGVSANLIPHSHMNQSPRNIYQCTMGSQAMATFTLNGEFRFDTCSHELMYAQQPLVQTMLDRLIGSSHLSTGANPVIAIMCYTGYGQEDSVIVSKSAIDMGMFVSTYERCYKDQEKSHGVDSTKFEKPNPKTVRGLRNANYEKIGANGLPRVGTIYYPKDVIIGKTMNIVDPTDPSNILKRDNSILVKGNEPVKVKRIVKTRNKKGHRMVKVIVQAIRVPEIGDKFCLTPDHEVLTESGWKQFTQLSLSDRVATLKDGQFLDYVYPSKIYEFDHDGPMYEIDTQQLSMKTTLNHKMWVQKRNKQNFEFVKAADVMGKRVRYQKDAMNTNDEYQFLLPSCNENQGLESMKDMDAWLTFFGVWMAEGWTSIRKEKNGDMSYRVEMSINKKRVKDVLQELSEKLGLHFCIGKKSEKLFIYNKRLTLYLSQFSVGAINKYLPHWVWELSQRQSRVLLDGMLLGDGTKTNSGTPIYFTSSKQLGDDVQKLALHCGWSANITVRYEKGSSYNIEGRSGVLNADALAITIVKSKNKPQVNHGHVNQQKRQKEHLTNYKGPVYCIEVPDTHLFYVRRNGKPVWTGNSSRHGQKGTAGMIESPENLPFCQKTGITPDIIVNPHAIPSRMTIGMLMECLQGKLCCLQGKIGDGTPFTGLGAEEIGKELMKYGFSANGEDTLFNGFTGELIQTKIFFVPCFYQRLKHVVIDKIHARARGPKQILTRQPVEGRSRDGGFRIGEMERDCIIAHGSSAFLLDRLFHHSDANETVFCKKCGFMAVPARPKGVFIKTMVVRAENAYCRNCRSHEHVVDVKMPYACKLMIQEMMAIGLAFRLELE